MRSCLIDGEVVCCDERGLAIFSTLRQRRNEARAFLFAFDLLELDGLDIRREPIETRKATLASLLRKGKPGMRLNEHIARGLGSEAPAGFRSRRGDGHDRTPVAPQNAAFPTYKAPRVHHAARWRGGGVAVGRDREDCSGLPLSSWCTNILLVILLSCRTNLPCE